MHLPTFDQIQGEIATVGYPALFGLLFACGFGLPLPEDVPLIIAGALIAKGSMTWFWAGLLAWCGIIGGDVCLYFISRKLGPRVTKLPLIRRHVTEERLERVHVLFDKYGVGVVAVGRLFAGIRGVMVVCAGTIRFNFFTFIVADGLAAVVSGGLWMLLGHWLGQNLTEANIKHYKHWIQAGLAVVAVLFVVWVIWKRSHKEQILAREEKVFEKVVKAETKVVQKITHKPPQSPGSVPTPDQQGH